MAQVTTKPWRVPGGDGEDEGGRVVGTGGELDQHQGAAGRGVGAGVGDQDDDAAGEAGEAVGLVAVDVPAVLVAGDAGRGGRGVDLGEGEVGAEEVGPIFAQQFG